MRVLLIGFFTFFLFLSFLAVPLSGNVFTQESQDEIQDEVGKAESDEWANRVMSNDPKVRATAEDTLVKGAERSLPMLKRFLTSDNEELHQHTFEIIRQIGPPAIPLLVELLRHKQDSFRRFAADALIDLAPDTESIQPVLRQALTDEDSNVVGDAARALGALGNKASPSVQALVKTLSHDNPYVRIYAAEALASIGPKASAATNELANAVSDPIPGVRWAACEALASFGPAAESAVPELIEALKDEFLYVRIFAAGALGSIGPKAKFAQEALRAAAANDPALRNEAEWALNRITGIKTGEAVVSPLVRKPSIAPQPQITVDQAGNPPVDWNITTGKNIVWSVELGNETFGRPVVAGDVVYVGTDNSRQLNPPFQEESGVLQAFRVTDGEFLWQDMAQRVERGLRDWLLPSTTSAPYVEGNRLYYVNAECQLRCLDTQGFRDGVNNGPYKEEVFKDNNAADIIWQLDIPALGVFPHEACNSDVLPLGDLLIVGTSNGQNEGHSRVPSPRAPSLIAVNKHSGEVVWRAIGPGDQVLHGNWSSPVAAKVNERTQVLFGGGDGWLRAYDAATGHEIWRFDGNPKNARWLPRPGVLSRGSIIASPVFADGRVFIAMGQSPGHGDGPSFIHAISPNGQGDVTKSGLLWTSHEVGRVVGTPIVKDGLLYVGDLGGTIHCLDATNGAHLWKHETDKAIWGCILLAGDRLYVGNVDGSMTILRPGRHKELLGQINMDAPLYSRPAVIGDALYLATAYRLYLIAKKP
jgi:outer membrane protein assembly factor BamB/HEAT repeat protein